MAGFDSHSFCATCCDKGKGKDPCVEKPESTACKFCNSLTSDQRSQLSFRSYKLKKEKREARKESLTTPTKDNSTSLNPSLVDPASVSVIGVVDGQGTLQSPGYSEPAEKKERKVEKDKGSTSKAKPSEKPVKPADKPTKSSTDSKIAKLGRLEMVGPV